MSSALDKRLAQMNSVQKLGRPKFGWEGEMRKQTGTKRSGEAKGGFRRRLSISGMTKRWNKRYFVISEDFKTISYYSKQPETPDDWAFEATTHKPLLLFGAQLSLSRTDFMLGKPPSVCCRARRLLL